MMGGSSSRILRSDRPGEETGQRTELSASLARLAWLEARQGRSEQSRLHADEALSFSREMGLGVCEVLGHRRAR